MKWDEETGIWDLELATKNHRCDCLLAAAIFTFYSPRKGPCLHFPESVLDVGCGDGRYCAIFQACGWDNIVGLEGTPGVKDLGVFNNIIEVDLTKSIIPIPSELVVCLEVGEHIPRKHEQTLINNICNCCTNHLVISWAVPGRGGSGHVNTRQNEYVIGQFEDRDMVWNEDMTLKLRDKCYFKWFKSSLLVFDRGEDDN